ncbi:MAG TPA: SAM-dependent methyltransferase [Opitutaceae bacterium]|nr:SAM-dependent methyltransferase [Opitutaceae bacterium]
MFPPTASDAAEDARFLAVFRAETQDRPATFAQFMALALYHPELGYYRRPRTRVGLAPEADFYTATSTGEVFGELVAAAAAKLLGPASSRGFLFTELGAEPGRGVLDGVVHPFGGLETRRLGEPLALSGNRIVFSNELFDAQPFHRLVRRAGVWRELGVAVDGERLVETELAELSPAVATCASRLPAAALDGYRLDLPLAAAALCAEIARGDWRGVFLAFDYGKTWTALATDTPTGTARGYRLHRQTRDLLAAPGRQDLTCHVCWDMLEESLATAGFRDVSVESQESFLIRHAGETAARIAGSAAGRPDQRRSRLHELLHPGLLGQRFQVLHARRD